jgi:hypothetical protein
MSDRKSPCASRTWHSDGRAISAAIRQQHEAALLSYPDYVRRRRTPMEWHALYKAAMDEKRRNGGQP